jgi:hypothetical protein
MTTAMQIPTLPEVGDQVVYDGTTKTIADVNWNYHPACPCRYGCPRVQFDGGGYARTCQLTPAPAAPAPLQPGQHRDFHAGRATITVVRLTADTYRVVVLAPRGLAVEPAREFTGLDARRDAAAHLAHLREVHASVEETPAAVAQRTADTRDQAAVTVRLTPPAKGTATKVTDPQQSILAAAAAHPAGYVRRGAGCGIKQLHALARRGYLELVVELDRARKVIRGGTITNLGRNTLTTP